MPLLLLLLLLLLCLLLMLLCLLLRRLLLLLLCMLLRLLLRLVRPRRRARRRLAAAAAAADALVVEVRGGHLQHTPDVLHPALEKGERLERLQRRGRERRHDAAARPPSGVAPNVVAAGKQRVLRTRGNVLQSACVKRRGSKQRRRLL